MGDPVSHPKDFTPVCTTELGHMAGLKPEFEKRNTKIIGLSVDPVENHAGWAKDIEETQGHVVNFPMVGDTELKIAKAYDMLAEGAGTTSEGRTPADNATVRSVFVIGPDRKIKAMLIYPMSSGRNFDEVLRLLEFLPDQREAWRVHAGRLAQGRRRARAGHHAGGTGEGEVPERLEDAEALSALGRAAAGLSRAHFRLPGGAVRRLSLTGDRAIFRQLCGTVCTYSYSVTRRRGGKNKKKKPL